MGFLLKMPYNERCRYARCIMNVIEIRAHRDAAAANDTTRINQTSIQSAREIEKASRSFVLVCCC